MTGLELLRQECSERLGLIQREILAGIEDQLAYMRLCGQYETLKTVLDRIEDIIGDEQ
jgi:hypothetical protein